MVDKEDLIDEAMLYLAANRSVTVVKGKFPWMSPEKNGEISWEAYKTARIDVETLIRLCLDPRTTGLCMICGQISGGAEIIDFDFKLDTCWYELWRERVGTLADGLPVQRTGGGGYQLGYTCPRPEGSQKLAHMATHDPEEPWQGLIETKGEGGLVVIPPSPHPITGNNYHFLTGHFTTLPMITQEHRNKLIQAARDLTQKPKPKPRIKSARLIPTYSRMQGETVIDAFNRQQDITDWLERYHYVVVSDDWAIRPGGERKTVKIKDNRSYHNAATDPLNDGYWRTPFELMMQHDDFGKGDFQTALHYASTMTGIPIQTWKKAPKEPERPGYTVVQAPEPPPTEDYSLVVITDDLEAQEYLEGLGLTVVICDRFGFDFADVQERIAKYERKIVILKPLDDGAATVLAADLGASLVNLPVRLTEFFADGSHGLIDFVAAVRDALKPVYRLGHKLGRRW